MTHPLDGAVARIERAATHIQELERTIIRFQKTIEKAFIRQQQADARRLKVGQYAIGIASLPLAGQVPLPAAVIVGEVIYNVRAALDYLIYELARKDSGCEQNGTQFPIQSVRDSKAPDCRYGFSQHFLDKLRGLSPSHIAAIEKLQPYTGCAWTKTLCDISNPDKHRKLTAVSGGGLGYAQIRKGTRGAFKNQSGKTSRSGKHDIHVHHQHAINVTLPDGMTPIVEALQNLLRDVSATVNAFKPVF